jgi:acetyltransferase-like isoleucine patch superfamily enzyme
MHPTVKNTPATVVDLVVAGLLELGDECDIHPTAVFFPADRLGRVRQIVLGDRVSIGALAIIHGGTRVGRDTIVSHRVTVGEPEYGYALRQVYPGAGAVTSIGAGVLLRGGATVYAGVSIGDDTTIGHNTLLRTDVTVGAASQLAANITMERGTTVGAGVRISAQAHITADTRIADRVFIGNGVRTINDKNMIWRDPTREEPLVPPVFEHAAMVGAGSTVCAAVTIGAGALVGAGSVVTRSIPPGMIAYGNPATVRRPVTS